MEKKIEATIQGLGFRVSSGSSGFKDNVGGQYKGKWIRKWKLRGL